MKRPGWLGCWRTSGDHPNDNIIENNQNTEKSPRDLRKFAVTQTPVRNHQLTLMWKNSRKVNNNNNPLLFFVLSLMGCFDASSLSSRLLIYLPNSFLAHMVCLCHFLGVRTWATALGFLSSRSFLWVLILYIKFLLQILVLKLLVPLKCSFTLYFLSIHFDDARFLYCHILVGFLVLKRFIFCCFFFLIFQWYSFSYLSSHFQNDTFSK